MGVNNGVKPFEPRIASLMSRNTFKNSNLASVAKFFENKLTTQFATLKIVGADEARYLATRFLQRLCMHARIEDDDWNTCPIGFHNRRNDLTRTTGCNTERRDLALNKVFDDLHLLLDVHFSLRCLND